jgi:hypothetical protein
MIIVFKANQQQHETRKTNSYFFFFFPLCGRATKRAKRVSFYQIYSLTSEFGTKKVIDVQSA